MSTFLYNILQNIRLYIIPLFVFIALTINIWRTKNEDEHFNNKTMELNDDVAGVNNTTMATIMNNDFTTGNDNSAVEFEDATENGTIIGIQRNNGVSGYPETIYISLRPFVVLFVSIQTYKFINGEF